MNNVILLLLVVLLIASCSTTKTVTVERVTTDSTATRQRDSLSQRIATLTNQHAREIAEIKSTGVVFSDCDTVIIDERCNMDSALRVISALRHTVRINPDGSIDAAGRIKAAYANSTTLQRELDRRDSIIQDLTIVQDSLVASKKVVSVVKDKDVKRGFPWLWFLIGMACGAVITITLKRYL
jgi:hypothetical protein